MQKMMRSNLTEQEKKAIIAERIAQKKAEILAQKRKEIEDRRRIQAENSHLANNEPNPVPPNLQ